MKSNTGTSVGWRCIDCGAEVSSPFYIGDWGPFCYSCFYKILKRSFEAENPNYSQGWECPRCHKINSPYISQCDCSRDETKLKKEEIVIDFNKLKTAEEIIEELKRVGIRVKEPEKDPFDALNKLKPETTGEVYEKSDSEKYHSSFPPFQELRKGFKPTKL